MSTYGGRSGRGGPGRGGPGRGGQGGRGGRGGYGGDRGGAEIFQQNYRPHYPDDFISKIETDTFRPELSNQLQGLNLTASDVPPTRPGFGTKGRKVELFANYFEVILQGSTPMYRYSVAVLPLANGAQPKGKKLARVVHLLLKQLPQKPVVVSDYSANIIASYKLVSQTAEYLIDYSASDDEPISASSRPQQYKVKVDFTATLELNDLLKYLSSTRLSDVAPAAKADIIQAMNIIIGHGLRGSGQVTTQGNKYFPFGGVSYERFSLGVGLDALRGYFLSVRAVTGRILLNTQMKHLASYKTIPLGALIQNLRDGGYTPERIEFFIRKAKVTVAHLPKTRFKTIFGFAAPLVKNAPGINDPQVKRRFATADEVRFWDESTQKFITVKDHFWNKYKQKSTLPVLNLGSRDDPKFFLAEGCQIVTGESFRPKLSPEHTRQMMTIAVRPPAQNAKSISTKGHDLIKHYSEKNLAGFGIKIGNGLIKVQGRVLDSPKVIYASTQPVRLNQGSWNMANIKFSRGAQLPRWMTVWITVKDTTNSFRDIQEVDRCVQRFAQVLVDSGLRAGARGPTGQLHLDNAENCQQAITERFRGARAQGFGARLLLIILPSQDASVYNAVKKAGEIFVGIHTVCVTASKFKFKSENYRAGSIDPNVQTFTNIALKFNLKLGGMNQQLVKHDLDFIDLGQTMIVGLDVTHPAPGENNAPSVAGIVASIDRFLGQWPADVRIQKRREEMIEGLKEMFKSRLNLWRKHNNNQLPTEVLVYRDGVSEGQYNLILQHELPLLRKACEETYPATATEKSLPRISIIVVGKRHHTRFYPTHINGAHQSTGNPVNGTLVDRGVTETRNWDFFLQPHAAIKGTARPPHYVVVHDEIFRSRFRSQNPSPADVLEKVTHNMSYMFGRATKAVSVCTPAYYADIVCERARRWLNKYFAESYGQPAGSKPDPREVTVHPNLRDTMFYI